MISSRFITVNNYRLHVLEAGEGPPVVLLHGFAGAAEDWRPSLELLARSGYRALAVDLLGFGRSDKPADAPYSLQLSADLLIGLLDQLGLERAAFVAHSMGGKYALATALLHPRRVQRLVLADTDGFVEPSPMTQAGGLPLLGTLSLIVAAQPAVLRTMLGAAFHAPETHMTAEVLARGRTALAGAENRRALLALSRNYNATDLRRTGLRARLGALRTPTLIVWGAQDRVFDLHYGEIARREIPDSQLVVIPRCGHFPQIEAFRAFHGLLLGFLAGSP